MADQDRFTQLDRRDFLELAAAGAIGLAFAGLTPSDAAAAPALPPLLGIGYAPALPAAGRSIAMKDAASVLTPDPAFISRAARVSVAGGARKPKVAANAGALGLDACFPAIGYESSNYPRFTSWYAIGSSVTGPLSFRIPVVSTGGISFVARKVLAGSTSSTVPPPDAASSRFTLSLGGAAGPKLQRGVYAIAFREDSKDVMPSWPGVSLVNRSGVYTLSGIKVSYALISIDYAEPEPA